MTVTQKDNKKMVNNKSEQRIKGQWEGLSFPPSISMNSLKSKSRECMKVSKDGAYPQEAEDNGSFLPSFMKSLV